MTTVRVIKPFKRRGEIIPLGSAIEVPEEFLPKLDGFVEIHLRKRQDPPPEWRPLSRSWIQNRELRTTGVFDDLADEIIRLTSDDLELQRQLLIDHSEGYALPRIRHQIEAWEERAAIMEYDGGLPREQAEEEAARQYNLLAFLTELRGACCIEEETPMPF